MVTTVLEIADLLITETFHTVLAVNTTVAAPLMIGPARNPRQHRPPPPLPSDPNHLQPLSTAANAILLPPLQLRQDRLP